MNKEIFNFAMNMARECTGKFQKGWHSVFEHAVVRLNEEYRKHWMSIVGCNNEVVARHAGDIGPFTWKKKISD